MPITKEFAIRQEDTPGTLGKLCRALADQNVNILAFQSFPSEKGKSSIHPTAAKRFSINNVQITQRPRLPT
jgi:hypothetical protein